jgi:hypothetical protein
MKRPRVITGLALLLFAADVGGLGLLVWMLATEPIPDLPIFLVALSGLLIAGWFLFALAAGLWELSIDAWWALVAFLSLCATISCVAIIMTAADGSAGDMVYVLGITSVPTLLLIYMFRVRRFFNGPLSMNVLALERH